jgi:hypothetical protein
MERQEQLIAMQEARMEARFREQQATINRMEKERRPAQAQQASHFDGRWAEVMESERRATKELAACNAKLVGCCKALAAGNEYTLREMAVWSRRAALLEQGCSRARVREVEEKLDSEGLGLGLSPTMAACQYALEQQKQVGGRRGLLWRSGVEWGGPVGRSCWWDGRCSGRG